MIPYSERKGGKGMAQSAATGYEASREEDRERTGLLAGIERTLRNRGTAAQRVLCLLLMALLAPANLPGGGYACQAAMFAVLLRQGFCVPFAFAGVAVGFAAHFVSGNLMGCWQMAVCALLWLTCGLWVRPNTRMTMAAAVCSRS